MATVSWRLLTNGDPTVDV